MVSFKLGSLLLLSIIPILSACGQTITTTETVEGSGNVVVTNREIASFSQVQINLGADLTLIQGDANSLQIESDDNLISQIKTEVRNGRLIVSTPDNVNLKPSQAIQIRVSFETLSEVEILGSSAIRADDLDLDTLAITFNGSGSTRLSGRVDDQKIMIRGMATLNNFEIISQQVNIDISGNGNVEVHAENNLDVVVAGMGMIRYTGNPTVTENISGAGTITRVQ